MTCRDLIEFLVDYLAGELKQGECVLFEAHLAMCPECVAYLNSYRRVIEAGRAAFDGQEEPVPEALIQAILAVRPQIAAAPPGGSSP